MLASQEFRSFLTAGNSQMYFSLSMPNMTGRPGHRTMEMIGGSSAPYLACTPFLSAQTQFFQTQFSTFLVFEVDQHSESKPQRESNMHRIEVHHFASPFAPNFPVGENSGFIQKIL